MAKPIVVMYLPENDAYSAQCDADKIMRVVNGNFGEPPGDKDIIAPEYWLDYYWFVFPKRDIEVPELQVFYEKDFTPINFEELKKFIEDTLKAKEVQP